MLKIPGFFGITYLETLGNSQKKQDNEDHGQLRSLLIAIINNKMIYFCHFAIIFSLLLILDEICSTVLEKILILHVLY